MSDDPNNPSLESMFPDATEFVEVFHKDFVIEHYVTNEEPGKLHVSLHTNRVPLEIIRDGVWAGISHITRIVYIHREENL